MNIIKTTFAAFILSVCSFANAGLIIEDILDPNTSNHHYLSVIEDGDISFSMTSTNVDTFLWLFHNDGDLDSLDYITKDDDGGLGTNSYISIFLSAGDYIISANPCCATVDETISMSFPTDQSGAYSLSIIGSVIETNNISDPITSIPEPSILVFFIFSVAGLIFRKSK